MLSDFERWARSEPRSVGLYFVDTQGLLVEYTLEDMRLRAARLALRMQERGIKRGDVIVADMENSPAFVALILAAAYDGLTVVILNPRLSERQKAERLDEMRHVYTSWDFNPNLSRMTEAVVERLIAEGEEEPSVLAHFAEHATALFYEDARALVMFTSGVTGRAKAAPLTWENLTSAAHAFNGSLSASSEDMWQAALPLYHIGGLQIVIRSFLAASPLILYRKFDPKRVLEDASVFSVTHISVVDKMLQDLLAYDVRGGLLQAYRCILLGGGALNPATVKQVKAKDLCVYASYGMTETSSNIALKKITKSFSGGLTLLSGYEVRIIMEDDAGRGQLAVRGPGVFGGYLNAQTPLTGDGFFLTGDRASLQKDGLVIYERTDDMFVSGGENVYPAEIEGTLKSIKGISDAYVFGAHDARWGRRPMAFVERKQGEDPAMLQEAIQRSVHTSLSKIHQPRYLFMLDELPRTGIGKIDCTALRKQYNERIEIEEVTLYRIEQELVRPFTTAQTEMTTRSSLIVQVKDGEGRIGLGECVAFETDWYLPETLDEDAEMLETHLIPAVLDRAFLHPRDAAAMFDAYSDGCLPMARGALEPALWDIYGKIVHEPLWRLIGGVANREHTVAAGVTLGMMSVPETLEAVKRAVAEGYTRVKLKVGPGDDVERVRALRKAFPRLTLMLDANQSYSEHDQEVLRKLDTLKIHCIEEPLKPGKGESKQDFFNRLGELQSKLRMRVCLDESIVTKDDLAGALSVPELACYAVKIGKFGGIQATLDLYEIARKRGIELWMAGMYETSVSKRMHAAFQTLPGIMLPGDLCATTHYFRTEIARPPFTVEQGTIRLNEPGFEVGLGCDLDEAVLEQVLVSKKVFARSNR